MKKNILIKAWAGIGIISVLAAGCGSKKAAVSTTSQPTAGSAASADTAATAPAAAPVTPPAKPGQSSVTAAAVPATKSLAFSTLVARAKAALAIGGKSNDVSMNIRIKDKQAIWVSVTAVAGLEVARAMITPDSVRVINRLDNVYITKPFTYIHEFTNNKITFATLQSILVGNIIGEFVDPASGVSIKVDQNKVEAALETILYQLTINEQGKVAQNNLSDAGAAQKLEVTYNDFQSVGAQLFPYSIVMKSEAKSKSISLDLKMSKVELDVAADMPFRVPERFEIKN